MMLLHLDLEVIGAAGGWQVEVVRDGTAIATHVMARAAGEGAQPAVTGGLSPADLDAVLRRIRARECQATDPAQLGEHLYAALLAPVWSDIDAAVATDFDRLELGIDLHGARELAYLPWELMRGPQGYLARGIDRPDRRVVEVAITRRNPRPPVQAPPLQHPLRYLFVIGTALNDSVRAGAECLGLLRQIGDRIQQRIIQRPSLSELAALVEEFKPHVVHVISHGEIDPATGAACLRLYDDSVDREVTVGAEGLADRLVRGGAAPTMVVLSACASGAPLAAGECEPLATGLIRAGVPIVIAMAGEIDDDACRLFARSFGEALTHGDPPVWAAVAGRRAALRSSALPTDAVDWAMIEVFLGSDVVSDRIAPGADDADAALIEGWLRRRDVDLLPSFNGRRSAAPFCGRLEIVEAFYQLMAERRPPVLCITARPPSNEPQSQLGKRRTLIELAAIATRAGHIPVPLLLHRKHPEGYPRTELELMRRLASAIRRTRTAYGLAPRNSEVVAALAEPEQDAWAEALAAELLELRNDAHRTHGLIAARAGKPIVLLNDIQEYGTATPYLLQTLVTSFGLGAPGHVIPVVLTFRLGSVHDDTLLDVTESEKRRSCLGLPMQLEPFAPGEDMLAYQRVLLQPYRSTPDAATRRWFLDLRRRPKLVARVRQWFARGTQGFPGKLWSDGFQVALEAAIPDEANGTPGIVRPVSDDDVLAVLERRP